MAGVVKFIVEAETARAISSFTQLSKAEQEAAMEFARLTAQAQKAEAAVAKQAASMSRAQRQSLVDTRRLNDEIRRQTGGIDLRIARDTRQRLAAGTASPAEAGVATARRLTGQTLRQNRRDDQQFQRFIADRNKQDDADFANFLKEEAARQTMMREIHAEADRHHQNRVSRLPRNTAGPQGPRTGAGATGPKRPPRPRDASSVPGLGLGAGGAAVGAGLIVKDLLNETAQDAQDAQNEENAAAGVIATLSQIADGPEDLKQMKTHVNTLRTKFGISHQAAAQTVFALKSVDALNDQNIELMGKVPRLGLDPSSVVDAWTIMRSNYGEAVGSVESVMNAMLTSAAPSRVDVSSLARAVGQSAMQFKTMGGDSHEQLAYIAVASNALKNPDVASERLASMADQINNRKHFLKFKPGEATGGLGLLDNLQTMANEGRIVNDAGKAVGIDQLLVEAQAKQAYKLYIQQQAETKALAAKNAAEAAKTGAGSVTDAKLARPDPLVASKELADAAKGKNDVAMAKNTVAMNLYDALAADKLSKQGPGVGRTFDKWSAASNKWWRSLGDFKLDEKDFETASPEAQDQALATIASQLSDADLNEAYREASGKVIRPGEGKVYPNGKTLHEAIRKDFDFRKAATFQAERRRRQDEKAAAAEKAAAEKAAAASAALPPNAWDGMNKTLTADYMLEPEGSAGRLSKEAYADAVKSKTAGGQSFLKSIGLPNLLAPTYKLLAEAPGEVERADDETRQFHDGFAKFQTELVNRQNAHDAAKASGDVLKRGAAWEKLQPYKALNEEVFEDGEVTSREAARVSAMGNTGTDPGDDVQAKILASNEVLNKQTAEVIKLLQKLAEPTMVGAKPNFARNW